MIQEKSSHQIWKSPTKTRTMKMRMRTTVRKMEMQETQHPKGMVKAKPLLQLLKPDQRERPQHQRKAQLPRNVSIPFILHKIVLIRRTHSQCRVRAGDRASIQRDAQELVVASFPWSILSRSSVSGLPYIVIHTFTSCIITT